MLSAGSIWRELRLLMWPVLCLMLVFGLAGGCSAMATPGPTDGSPQPVSTQAAEPAMSDIPSTATPPAAATREVQPSPIAPTPLTPPAALQERRMLVLEYPPRIRVGNSDVILLTLEVDPEGQITPTAEYQGHSISGEPVLIPDLYSTHNILAEARLDLAGMQIDPQGAVIEPMRPGQVLKFSWSLSPRRPGYTRGTLWLFLNLVPKDGGEIDRRALMAYRLEIEATSVLGLPANLARWAGVAGSGLSLVVGFPFVENFVIWLWRKARRRKKRKISQSSHKKGTL